MVNNIQILRALAVIMVIAYHSAGLVSKYGFGFNDVVNISHWGAFGVDIFFVISGYIMAMIDDKKNKPPYEFAKDRVFRIVPLYWMMTIGLIVIQAVMPDIFRETIYQAPQNISSLLFISSYFGYEYPTLYVGWSLELEMFFYAVFAACLFIGNKNNKLLVMTAVITLLSITSIIKPIAIEFVFGIGVYYFSKNVGRKDWSIMVFALMIAFAMIVMSATDMSTKLNSSTRPFTAGVVSLVLVLAAVMCRDAKKSALTYIGDASYSLYLIQVFTIPVVIKLMDKTHLVTNGYGVFFLAILFTLIVGAVFYALIEKTITRSIKNIRIPSYKRA